MYVHVEAIDVISALDQRPNLLDLSPEEYAKRMASIGPGRTAEAFDQFLAANSQALHAAFAVERVSN